MDVRRTDYAVFARRTASFAVLLPGIVDVVCRPGSVVQGRILTFYVVKVGVKAKFVRRLAVFLQG